MARNDNAAWRLLHIVERGLQAPNGTIRDFWANAFDVRRDDTAAIFRNLSMLFGLVDEVEEKLRALDDLDRDYYLKHLPAIRKAIGVTNLDQNANSIAGPLGGMTLRDIGFWARTLSEGQPDVSLNDDELRALADEVDALFEVVRNADIPDELKRVVLAAIEGIRRAIVEFWLRGTAGLRDELDRAVVMFARFRDDFAAHTGESWFQKLCNFLAKADAAAEKGRKYIPLLKQAAKLLPPGTLPSIDG